MNDDEIDQRMEVVGFSPLCGRFSFAGKEQKPACGGGRRSYRTIHVCTMAFALLLTPPRVPADESWTQLSPLPETRSLRCLIYAGGTYYAAGIAGAFLRSQDTITWLDQ